MCFVWAFLTLLAVIKEWLLVSFRIFASKFAYFPNRLWVHRLSKSWLCFGCAQQINSAGCSGDVILGQARDVVQAIPV